MPRAKKPAPAADTPEIPALPAAKGSTVHARHIAAAVDAVGRTLSRTFDGFGFCLVVFDKRKPDQTQHFLGGDRKACSSAMAAVTKKVGA